MPLPLCVLELGSAPFKIDAKRGITPSIAPRDFMNAAILEWTIGRMQIAARRLIALLVRLECDQEEFGKVVAHAAFVCLFVDPVTLDQFNAKSILGVAQAFCRLA